MRRLNVVILLCLMGLPMGSLGQLANSPWPKFHQNTFNTGLGLGSGSNGLLRWKYATQGMVESSPAIAADGTVYVGSDDGNLYALTSAGLSSGST
jgi:hypothetical protein